MSGMKPTGNLETYDVFNPAGERVGQATRAEVHRDPRLIHRAVHVLVWNPEGKLLLQKRGAIKDVEPGKWDTSVGGHLDAGEDWLSAARREMKEELGVEPGELVLLYDFRFSSPFETEDIRSFSTRHPDPFRPNPEEIEQVRFWNLTEIRRSLGSGAFSRNFEEEIRHYFSAVLPEP